jgi:toxin ParE1/3/4
MVVWRPAARVDLLRIVRHIAEENPFAARRVGRELVLTIDSLETFPYRGRRGRISGTRELVAIAPYVVVYDVAEEGTVFILRIWHGAQERP